MAKNNYKLINMGLIFYALFFIFLMGYCSGVREERDFHKMLYPECGWAKPKK